MKEMPSSIAIVELNSFHGKAPFRPGMPLVLVKEPENPQDAEMIVAVTDVGPVGVVANSSDTVPLGCASAGRMYDTFPDAGLAVVRYVMDNLVIAELINGVDGAEVPDFVYIGIRMLNPEMPEAPRGRLG
jgi:hypothetical protein